MQLYIILSPCGGGGGDACCCVVNIYNTLMQNFSLSMAGERLTKRLRYHSFKAMLRQEMAWFDRKTNSTGALLTRLASDTAAVKGVSIILRSLNT